MKVKDGSMALIAAKSCPWRDSLQFLLLTLPQIEIVIQTGDALSALRLVTKHQPSLVVLDANLSGNGLLTFLERIKIKDGRSRLLAFVNNRQQQQDAVGAGADLALINGYPASKLYNDLDKLLSEERDINPIKVS